MKVHSCLMPMITFRSSILIHGLDVGEHALLSSDQDGERQTRSSITENAFANRDQHSLSSNKEEVFLVAGG